MTTFHVVAIFLITQSMELTVRNLLQCPVCQDQLTVPMVLPRCGHSFCYTCVKTWCQSNPNCPICRTALDSTPPVLNHTLNAVTSALFTGNADGLAEYRRDEQNAFPWLHKLKAKFGRAVVDDDDNVPRCSACHWELIDGQCENCGRTMVGWNDRVDGDDNLNSENEDDGWEAERRSRHSSNRRAPLQLDSDQVTDYDNGINDRDDDDIDVDEDYISNDDDVDWGDDENLPENRRRRPINVYESVNDEGEDIILDSDGERPLPGHPVRLVKLSSNDITNNDTSHWEDHEREAARRPWIDEYDSDDGFVVNDNESLDGENEDGENDEFADDTVQSDNLASGDEDLLESSSTNRNRVVNLDSDDEDDEDAVVHHRRKPVVEIDDIFSDDDEDMISSLKSSTSNRKQIHTLNDSDDDDDDDIIIIKRKPPNRSDSDNMSDD